MMSQYHITYTVSTYLPTLFENIQYFFDPGENHMIEKQVKIKTNMNIK